MQVRIEKASLDRFRRKIDPAKRDLVIRSSLTRSASYLVGWIKTNRLMGPQPKYLGRVSHSLFASVKALPTIKTGTSYRAIMTAGAVTERGFNYGKYWEGVSPFDGVRKRPPKPFMRPAIKDRQNIESVKRDLIKAINRALGVS